MNDRDFDQFLGKLMKQNLSAGTEAFRDDLLARCLQELDASEKGIELDEADLDLLAAAGQAFHDDPNDRL